MLSPPTLAAASSLIALIALGLAAMSTRFPGSEVGRGYRWMAVAAFSAWFLVAVLTRSLWLYSEVGMENAWSLVGWDLVVAGCFLSFWAAVWRGGWVWALWVFVVGYTGLCWVHFWHWRFFEDLFALGSVRAVSQVRFLGESVVDLAVPLDFVLLLDISLGLLAAWMLWLRGNRVRRGLGETDEQEKEQGVAANRRPRPSWGRLVAILVAVLSSSLLLFLGRAPEQKYFDRVSMLEEKGVLALHLGELLQPVRQIWWRQSGAVAEQDVHAWFAETAHRRGLGKGEELASQPWNVVFLQVESFQDFVLDLDVGSPSMPVMPNLRRRLKSGFRFLNTYDQTHLGRTSDAEMLVMTSLLPVSSTAAAIRFGSNYFVGLPRVLGSRGYSSFSAVPFGGSFWNRRTVHPAYGFQTSYFTGAFEEKGERVGWGLNDQEFLAQAMHLVRSQPEPFVSLLITLSLHTPYENFPDRLRGLPELRLKNQLPAGSSEQPASQARRLTQLRNYLEAMRFFDLAFETFMSGLEASGLAQRTVVVLYGDHDATLVQSRQLRRHLGISWKPPDRLTMDRVPLVIWVPGAVPGSDGDPWGGWLGQTTGPTGLVDVAPTVLGILGIDAGDLPWQGRNLHRGIEGAAAAEWGHGPVPVGLTGHWVSSDLVYISKGPGPYRGQCYRMPRFRRTNKKEPCVQGALEIERQLSVARDILRGDLHRRSQ